MITALSIRQPWAWAILYLGKDLENRTWSTDWRGSFVIHASKACTRAEYYACLATCREVAGSSVLKVFPPLAALPRGGIVGAARLVDVLPRCPSWPCSHPWHMRDDERGTGETQYGFRLDRVRPAPRFVPCDGRLGFWPLPPRVERELRRAA